MKTIGLLLAGFLVGWTYARTATVDEPVPGGKVSEHVRIVDCDVHIRDTRARYIAGGNTDGLGEPLPGCWYVEVLLQVLPKPVAGVGYVAGDNGRVLLEFVAHVDAASEADAVYKVAMAAFEHELLECMHVDGKQWRDPHESMTPIGVRVLGTR
jgi:hypothetical protein